MSVLYLFPDTNLFVQCKPLGELGWERWADFELVELVLTRPVQAELDKQKIGQGRIAKRARAANSKIRVLLHSEEVVVRQAKPRVRLVLRTELKRSAVLSDDLDYKERDDQLVGIASAFRDSNPGVAVALLTHDTGPMASAKRVGLDFFEIPEEWLLATETDETEKRIHALQSELDRYQRGEPHFQVRCEGSPLRFCGLKYTPLTESEVAELVQSLTLACPMASDFGGGGAEAPHKAPRTSLPRFYREEFVPASEEEIEHYRTKLYPQWLTTCEAFFRGLSARLDSRDGVFEIYVGVTNDGSRPAQDAYIKFELAGAFLMVASEQRGSNGESEGILKLPSPPVPPFGRWVERTIFPFRSDPFALGRNYPAVESMAPMRMPQRPRDPNAFYWKSDAREIPATSAALVCDQWRHQAGTELFAFRLLPEGKIGAQKGALRIEVHAANLTKPHVHVEPILATMAVGDTLNVARKLVEDLEASANVLGKGRE